MKNWYEKLKADQWWDCKIPSALIPIYLHWSQVAFRLHFSTCLFQLSAFICSYIGLAGLGHVINDYFDRTQDAHNKRANFFLAATLTERRLLLPLLLTCAFGPWLYLKASPGCLALIGLEIGLFLLYSAPPCRGKERGRWAHLLDASYAYAIPLVLPCLWLDCASLLTVGCLLTWACLAGVSQNLVHQLLDNDHDLRAGSRTFVVRRGWSRCRQELAMVWTPLELASFLLLLASVSSLALLSFVIYASFNLSRHLRSCLRWREDLDRFVRSDLLSWYVHGWCPVLALTVLLFRQPQLAPLAILHLLVFANPVRRMARERWNH